MKLVSDLPYPGLRAFARNEAHLFFGREKSVNEMIERLAATRFLAVLGASGSGKSSLVRTGLLSSLDLGFFAKAGARWTIAEFNPGGQPLRNLAAALSASGAQEPMDADLMRAMLARGPGSVAEWCAKGGLAEGHNLLILVDQFEELFRYGDYAAREEAEALVRLLLESAKQLQVPIHVVLTMRSEYLGACALIPGLAEEINAGFYLTPRMSREECRSAIEGPAAIGRFTIEPALVNQILNDMASLAPWEEEEGVARGQLLSRRADQLPLMQHLLNRLWLRATMRAGEGPVVLKFEDYDEAGGLAGALDAHGREVMESLDRADRPQVETVFRALVSGPDPANAIRRPCPFGKLAAEVKGGADAARRIVEAFRAANCNFLRPESKIPLDDDALVDISHESLIRQWSALAEWLHAEARAGANWRRLLTGVERRRDGWLDLFTGLELASLAAWWDAEAPTPRWAERHGGHYEEVRQFLADSREAEAASEARETARTTRERHRLIGGVAVLAILLMISTGGLVTVLSQGETIRQNEGEIRRKGEENETQRMALASLRQTFNRRNQESLVKQTEAQEAMRRAEVEQERASVAVENAREADRRAATLQAAVRDTERREAEGARNLARQRDHFSEVEQDRRNLLNTAADQLCRSNVNEEICAALGRGAAGNNR